MGPHGPDFDDGSTWDKMEEMFERDTLNFVGIG
jgi:hypothetical protein